MKKIFLLTCCVFFVGCGGTPKPDGMPKLASCVITITSEGQPLPDVDVGFYHSDPNFRWNPGAVTDASGKATMVTYGQYFGAPDGDYVVTVSKLQRESFDPEKPPRTVKVFSVTDPKFVDPKTTPLKITVTGKTTETFDVGKTGEYLLREEDAR